MNSPELPTGSMPDELYPAIDDTVEVVSGEITDGVLRNAQGQILDADGQPLEQVAELNTAAIQGLQRGVQLRVVTAEDKRDAWSYAEAMDLQDDAKDGIDRVQAALWRSQRHYNRNPVAYHQAGIEEDERRSQEKPQPELPSHSS